MRRVFWVIFIVGMAYPTGVSAGVPTPQADLKTFAAGQGEDFPAAVERLKELPDLLKKYRKDLAAMVTKFPLDGGVAGRVMDLVAGRGAEGCAFISSLVDKAHPAWVDETFRRGAALPACPALSEALANVLAWLPDPSTSTDSARLAVAALNTVRETRYAAVGERICRFVSSGPDDLRMIALAAADAARPPDAEACLVRAYTDERNAERSSERVRRELLRVIAAFAGANAVPTLVLALDDPRDKALACEMLLKFGKPAVDSLIFALRTSEARPSGSRDCLMSAGEAAISGVLPLFDHKSEKIRAFAVEFLSRYHSPEALRNARERFADATPAERSLLLTILGSYPEKEVKDVLEAALSDADADIRIQALLAIEQNRSQEFLERILGMAEEDQSPPVRKRALEAAWHLGAPAVVPLAFRMMQYELPDVAVSAVAIVGFAGDSKSVDVLETLLKHKDAHVASAARDALWLLTYKDPDTGVGSFRPAPQRVDLPIKGREVAFSGGSALVLGRKGPPVVVLPGGPGMDMSWAWPGLEDLADDAVVAFVIPPKDHPNRLLEPVGLEDLLKALGVDRAVLVSAGLGGTAAFWLAARVPGRVAGVVAVSAPLPGRLAEMEEAMSRAMPEPYRTLAANLEKERHLFLPEVYDRLFARVAAPAWAGSKMRPDRALVVSVDSAACDKAREALALPEVRFEAMDYPGRVLLVGSKPALGDAWKAWEVLAGTAPDRVKVLDLPACGLLPVTSCPDKVVEAAIALARDAIRPAGK